MGTRISKFGDTQFYVTPVDGSDWATRPGGHSTNLARLGRNGRRLSPEVDRMSFMLLERRALKTDGLGGDSCISQQESYFEQSMEGKDRRHGR